MSITQDLRKRINFQGEFDELLIDVCSEYSLGKFVGFEVIEMGYEDVNLKLTAGKGNYFVKIFAEKRDDSECLRLINVVKIALDNGVSHPQFLVKDTGYIFRGRYEDFNIRLAVFEFIDGKTFYELKKAPSKDELKEIIKMAASINSIDYKTADLYDSWALVNYAKELEKSRKYLAPKELKVLDSLLKEFEKVDIKSLPHSLVHGDLISPNIMKAKDRIYFVDFSVANYYPRIVELAVLMSDVMFDPTGKNSIEKQFKNLVSEYSKYIELSAEELKILPLFIKLAHAMHLVRATREKAKGNKSAENEHWLTLGKKGLEQSISSFK